MSALSWSQKPATSRTGSWAFSVVVAIPEGLGIAVAGIIRPAANHETVV
jgi:hypothetical protein